MKMDVTELVMVLDKSGSMASMAPAMVAGYNALVERQKQTEGEVLVTTVLFDTNVRSLYVRLPLRYVPELTLADYRPGGCTALLDGLGQAVSLVKARQEEDGKKPERTIVVVMTDGCENSSGEYDGQGVKALVEERRQAGWEFVFLGASIDSFATASRLGIDRGRAAGWRQDEHGIKLNFEVIGRELEDMRRQRRTRFQSGWAGDIMRYAGIWGRDVEKCLT